jgi:hypothetical protein
LRAVGAEMDARDRDGKTARDLAREGGLSDIAVLV